MLASTEIEPSALWGNTSRVEGWMTCVKWTQALLNIQCGKAHY